MAPDERKTQILGAARRVLTRDGINRFSLEAVAREAGVAATLPRHYFDSRDRLLAAALIDMLHEVTDVLIAPGRGPYADRLHGYAAIVSKNTRGHELWLRAAYVHPDAEEAVRAIRRQMIEGSFNHSWDDMTTDEQLAAAGWAGFFEGAVSEWIRQGADDQDQLVDTLLDAARRFGVRGA